MHKRLFLILPLAVTAFVVLLCPDALWARAGGGGGYGGGGGGGGGFGGGGGSGDGNLIALLIWLVVRYPLIGIPLLIGLGVLFLYGGTQAHSGHMTRTIRRGHERQQRAAREQALARLRGHDPEFDERQLLERMSSAFQKIQDAWSRQALGSVRPFISDGIYERFTLQIAMQRRAGYRNELTNVRVLDTSVAALYSETDFDTIHVRFEASAVDYNVSLETGERLGGSTQAHEFVEYWSFHRRPGARTLARPGAIEGNCPNCAAPLQIVDRAECPACGSTVNSGEFDWVLAEITQAQEWRVPGDQLRLPGISQLKAADPGFSAQHIEDRVSVMFWRLQASEYFADVNYATPVLAPEFAQRQQQHIEDDKRFVKDPAVGKVEILAAELGTHDGMDRLQVLVRWSGVLSERLDRERARALRPKSIYTHVYVLARHSGVKSTPARTFSSNACPQCGAPIAPAQEASCRYCDNLLVDGRFEWVLESVDPYTPTLAWHEPETSLDREISRFQQEVNGHADYELSLAVLARVMHIDGQLDDRERERLAEIGRRRGLTQRQVDEVIGTAATEDSSIPLPENPRQAREFLRQLIHASLADGKLTQTEKRLLTRYADRVDLAAADVRLLIAQERRREYQQARRTLRGRELAS